MELKFTGQQIYFLNAVIRQPTNFLPLAEAGMVQVNGSPTPFKAGPKDRKRVIALKNWIESLMEYDKDKDQYIFPDKDKEIETRLTTSMIEYLRDMIMFYERVGSLVQYCEVFEQTLNVLDGKPLDSGVDSLEEVMGPKGEKTPAKVDPKEDKKEKTA